MPADIEEPAWLHPDQIERLNEKIVERSGEDHLVLSRALLEGACARPQNLWLYETEKDIITLAVRLMEGIGRNHCFQQGNKRTAFNAGMAFLRINGVRPLLPDNVKNAAMIEGLITGEAAATEVIALISSTLAGD